MRYNLWILLMATTVAASSAQTSAKPVVPKAVKPAVTASKPAVTGSKTAVVSTGIKLPPGVPPEAGTMNTAFTLRYQDITVGAGPEAEPGKMFKVHYTGYFGTNDRPDDGHKFDSSYDHRMPETDKDGKPVLGDDGKPKLEDPQPLVFPQGYGRLIPGFDQGVSGMRIGGKRRIFIPWQLAYGAIGRPGPDAAHPGMPPKSNLIFDVELLDVSDLPAQPNHPSVGAERPAPGAGASQPTAEAKPAPAAQQDSAAQPK
jgi:peptidylprolyl isomerase